MIRQYRTLPDVPTGYPLDDVWSVVVPIARTNLVINPSFETNTTSWTASGGSIARSTTYQYHGAYSLAITPTAATTDGARYDTVSLTSGTTYAYSAKIKGVAGLKYKLSIETTGAAELNAVTFTATGRWQWIWGYYTETSSTTRRVYARKAGHASTAIFYLDGVQVEAIVAGETVSTYCDGDQLGLVPNQQPVAYVWNGTPHASSSTRSGQTRAGGMVISFKKYGFLLTAMIGLGLAGVQNVATDYARIDGAYDDYTRKPPRQFTLTGRFQGRTYAELRRNRSGLAQLFDRDLTGQDQRLTLLRTVEDGYGRIVSTTTRTLAKYESGLAGNTDNQHAETVPITFTQYLPGILADGESGAALDVQDNVSNANYIQVLNTATGLWSSVSSGTVNGATGDVNAIVVAPDGKVYIGGVFALASGVANTVKIAYYDPTDGLFHPLGTGATGGNVSWMAMGPDGVLYAAGSFTGMGGIANTNNIAKWNGSAWSALGTGVTGGSGILAMAVDSQNNLYVGGSFTTMGGVANTTRIAKWNGSAWSALGTGANDVVRAIVIGPGDIVYLGGDFTTVNGTSAIRVASWNGTAASALSVGMDSSVRALGVGPNNVLYAAGDFSTAGGATATRAASWNGAAWTPMGAGLGTSATVLTVLPDGTVWEGGASSSGSVTFRSPMARWNGSSWVGSDNNLVSSSTVQAITPDRAGKLYVGYSSFGTATQGGLVTITNPGTARAYPTVKLYGPSSGTARIYQITNPTTGRAVYLNLTLVTGETATLVFQPDSLSFTTDFRGNIASSLLPGSNEADFFLQPGANVISTLSANTTVVAVLYFRPAYASMDDTP